jgi:hypothetical protein
MFDVSQPEGLVVDQFPLASDHDSGSREALPCDELSDLGVYLAELGAGHPHRLRAGGWKLLGRDWLFAEGRECAEHGEGESGQKIHGAFFCAKS